MPLEPDADFRRILAACDAENLYEAAREFAARHRNLPDGKISITSTSQTVMNDMMAKTALTPEDKCKAMRENRKEAISDFCYIYGGYIAYRLKEKLKIKFPDAVKRDELIAQGTIQILDALLRKLERDGYKRGTFSHLVNCAVKRKAIDISKRYAVWEKNRGTAVSFDDIQDILGGAVDIMDENGSGNFDDRELDFAGILGILKRIKTTHSADDLEMFIRYHIRNQTLAQISKEFDVPVPTVSRRIIKFQKAAAEFYRRCQDEMERI